MAGNGNVTKVGPGKLILSGASTFSGQFKITGGTVQTGGGTGTVFGNTANTIVLDGGTIKNSNIGNGSTFLNSAYTLNIGPNGGTIAVDDAPGQVGRHLHRKSPDLDSVRRLLSPLHVISL